MMMHIDVVASLIYKNPNIGLEELKEEAKPHLIKVMPEEDIDFYIEKKFNVIKRNLEISRERKVKEENKRNKKNKKGFLNLENIRNIKNIKNIKNVRKNDVKEIEEF